MTHTTQGNRSLPVWKRLMVWLVLVSFAHASAAKGAIGDTFKNTEAPVKNLLAHAVLGCATGVVKSRGEGQGCAAGAAGAAGAVAGDVAGQRATVACDAVRAEAKTTAQGLDLYTRALVDKVDKGEMTYAQAKPYMDQAQREKRDITSPLAADAYVRSGGVADPGNPAWVEYKALTATEGNDAAMALGMGSAGGRYEGQHGGKAPVGARPAEGEGAGAPSAGANGGVVEAPVTSGGTANSATGLGLNKSLASEQQVAQITAGGGNVMAGNGSSVPLRDAPRLAAEYGGNPKDWSKVSSSSYTAADGSKFEVHAYRNAITGQVVEPKTIQPITFPGDKP